MRPEMFERLQETIGRDKRIESLPFCAETDKGVEIVSGHHRVRAARAAGLLHVAVVVDTTGLSRSQIRAKQLAHNAISGYDDPDVLARIYAEIDDMEARLETFIDEAELEGALAAFSAPDVSLKLEYRTALIAFFPHQAEIFARAVDQAVAADAKDFYLADFEQLDDFRDLVARLRQHYEVRALGPVLETMARIVSDHLGVPDEAEPDPEAWLPLVDVGGGKTALVPPEAAAKIEDLVAKIRAELGDEDLPFWACIEHIAER
jgi:hypothetical protein